MIITYVPQHRQTQAEIYHPEISSENQSKTPTSKSTRKLIT